MKNFKQVIEESTCQKRITVCEIYDRDNNLLARESNRCNPIGGICHRLGIVQNKENYDKGSHCNWTHAEVNAIMALPTKHNAYKAIIYGHDFFCSACEALLLSHGIVEFEVNNTLLKRDHDRN